MTQTILEANLVGDLAEMRVRHSSSMRPATPIARTASTGTPDNLSDIQNIADPIAGLFPERTGRRRVLRLRDLRRAADPDRLRRPARRRALQPRARLPDLGLEHGEHAQSRALTRRCSTGAVSPRYRTPRRLQSARLPRAQLGELYSRRRTPPAPAVRRATGVPRTSPSPARSARRRVPLQRRAAGPDREHLPLNDGPRSGSEGVRRQPPACRAVTEQPTAGPGLGIATDLRRPESFREQRPIRGRSASRWTSSTTGGSRSTGTRSRLRDMIATEGLDATYQRCLDMAFNPTGDTERPCPVGSISRNPNNGGAATTDRSFTNEGLVDFSGIDLSLRAGRIRLMAVAR